MNVLGSLWNAWIEALTTVKHLIKPGGLEILEEVINAMHTFDKAMKNGDLAALESLYFGMADLTKKLVPYIKNEDFAKLWSDTSNECAVMSKRIANGASLADILNFEEEKTILIASALI